MSPKAPITARTRFESPEARLASMSNAPKDAGARYSPILDANGNPYFAETEFLSSQRPESPGIPLVPILPRGSLPRTWSRSGVNLNIVPRSEMPELTPFAVLRNLADASDIVRLAIEDVKSQVLGLEWDVHPRDPKETGRKDEIEDARRRLSRPDGVNDFRTWLGQAIEEVLVTDALSIYRMRTVSGEPHSLRLLDGSTIKPIVDLYGMPPCPPEIAFEQIISGAVETGFTRPYSPGEEAEPGEEKIELVYAPKSRRVFSAYGQSPTERVILATNLALRRQMYYLAYYTEGNVPEAFWKVPESWTPTQVLQMQKDFDELLAGDDEARRRLRFMPGGQGVGLENPRGNDAWTKDLDEWLARVVCYAFNTSPLPLVAIVNRATAQTMDVSETDSGHHPLMRYVEDLLTREIEEFFGYVGLRFIWTEDKFANEELFVTKSVEFVKAGIYTIDEVRSVEGKDPTGIPRFTLAGPNGLQVLDRNLDERLGTSLSGLEGNGGLPVSPGPKGEAAQALDVPLPVDGSPAPGGPVPSLPPGQGKPEKPGAGEAARALDVPLPKAASRLPEDRGTARESEAREDLKRWKKIALKAIKGGKRIKAFESSAIPEAIKTALRESLDDARTREDVEFSFRLVTRARRPLVSVRRRKRTERKLRTFLSRFFREAAPKIADLFVRAFEKVPKKQEPETKTRKAGVDGPSDGDIDAAFDWDVFIREFKEPLSEAFLEGESIAQDVGGIEVSFGLTEEQAIRYAETRAAELVGKRVLDDGTIVDNPNPKWSVPESTREQIRNLYRTAIEEAWTPERLRDAIEHGPIWDWRADMIARTETAIAMNRGTTEVYRGSGIDLVKIHDGPGCLVDDHDDTQKGVDGEIWTISEFEANPIGHPNCRRDASPVFGSEE